MQKRQFYRSAWVAFEFEDDVKKAIKELELKKVLISYPRFCDKY